MVKVGIEIDVHEIIEFAKVLKSDAKPHILRELAIGYGHIGRHDINRFRSTGFSRFKAGRAKNSFKYKSSDPARVKSPDQLFVSEYTKWKAAGIYETGGTIHPKKGRYLTIPIGDGIRATGKRKYTQGKLRQMLDTQKASIIPTPRGLLIVRNVGGTTKSGRGRKGTRSEIIGMMLRSVKVEDRLDFTKVAEKEGSAHLRILGEAMDRALKKTTSAKKGQ